MRSLSVLLLALALNGTLASAESEHGTRYYGDCYSYAGYTSRYSSNGCTPIQVLGTPAFILPPLANLPDGNGNDKVQPTTLSKGELKNSMKALDAAIKSSTNKYSSQSKQAAEWEFQNLASFMKKNPGGSCYDAGAGMVCTGANGKSSTYNFLTSALVSRALAKKDGNTVTSYNSRVTNTVAAVNAATNAAYSAYLNNNASVSPGATSQTAFASTTPVSANIGAPSSTSTTPTVVLPQSSSATRDPAAAVSVSYQGQSVGVSH